MLKSELNEKEEKANLLATSLAKIITETHKKSGPEAIPFVKLYIRTLLEGYYKKNPPANYIYHDYNKYRAHGKLDLYLQSSVADRVQPLTGLFAEVLGSTRDVSALQEIVYLNLLVITELDCEIHLLEEFVAQLISYYEGKKIISEQIEPGFEELYIIFLNDYIYNPTAWRLQDWLQSKQSVGLASAVAEAQLSYKDERTIADLFFTNDDCILFIFTLDKFIQYFKPLTNFSIAQVLVRASVNENLLQSLCQPFILPILNSPIRTRGTNRLALSSYLSQSIYDISVSNKAYLFWQCLDLNYYFELHPDSKKLLIQEKPELIKVIVSRLLKDPSAEVVEELDNIEKVQPAIVAELVNDIAVAFSNRLKQLPDINPKMASEALSNLLNKINKLQQGKNILERMDPGLTSSLNRTEKRNMQKKFPHLGKNQIDATIETTNQIVQCLLPNNLKIPKKVIMRAMERAQKRSTSQNKEVKTSPTERLTPTRPRSKSLPDKIEENKNITVQSSNNTLRQTQDLEQVHRVNALSDSESRIQPQTDLSDSETDKLSDEMTTEKIEETMPLKTPFSQEDKEGNTDLKLSGESTEGEPGEAAQMRSEQVVCTTNSFQATDNVKNQTPQTAVNKIVPDDKYREHLTAIVAGEKTLSINLTEDGHFIIDFSTLPDLWYVTANIGQNPHQASMSSESKHTIISSIIRSLKTYKDISNTECRIETIPDFPLQLKVIPKSSHLMYPEKSHKFCFELLKKHANVTKIVTPQPNKNKFETKTNPKPKDIKKDTQGKEQTQQSLTQLSPTVIGDRLKKVLHHISTDRFPQQNYHILIKPTYNAKKKVFVFTVDRAAPFIVDKNDEQVEADKAIADLVEAIKTTHGDVAVRTDKDRQKSTVLIFYFAKINIDALEHSVSECRKNYKAAYEKAHPNEIENEDYTSIISAIETAMKETTDAKEIKQLTDLLELFKPTPRDVPPVNTLTRVIHSANLSENRENEVRSRISKLNIHNAVRLAKVHLERHEFDKINQICQNRKSDQNEYLDAFINTCFRQGGLDGLLIEYYLTYSLKLNINTFDSIFLSSINSQRFDVSRELLRTYPAFLNQKLCVLWLDALMIDQKYLEAINFANEMIDKPYSVHVAAILIRAYTHIQDFESATKIFSDTPKGDHTLFHKAWLLKLQAEHKSDECLNYLTEISTLPIYLDDCVAIVLATLVSNKDFARGNQLYQQWQHSNSTYLQETQFFSLYKQGRYEEAIDFYCRYRLSSLRAQATLLDVYKETEQYELATTLYHSIKEPNTFVQQTWLQILVRTKQSTAAIEFYLRHLSTVNNATLPHSTILNLLLNDNRQLPLMIEILERMEKVCQSLSNHARRYLSAAGDVAFYYHQLHMIHGKQQTNLSESTWKLIEEKTLTFINIMKSVIQLNPWISPTVREISLLGKYFPGDNFTPAYEGLSEEKMDEITEAAYQASDHSLTALRKESDIIIDEVNWNGQKIGEYRLNHSIYREISHAALPNYVIVKFQGPMRGEHLPLYITYRGEIYRTDLFGGSKLRQRLNIDQFASMIAVPLVASEYFSRFLNHRESFGRAQRTFLPEEADTTNLGLKGTFRIMAIPDHVKVPVFSHFMTQDGGGYIKRSIANQIGLPEGLTYQPSPAFLTYQASHCYANNIENQPAVMELSELANSYLGQIAPTATITPELARNFYYALSSGLPSYMGMAIPVIGSKLVLPNTELWRSHAKCGVLVGRNPYDSKQLQYIGAEDILYCDYLAGAISIQYTLTGYEKIPGIWNDLYVGHSFKGMLTLVDDEQWPLDYQACDILISSKDRKLCTSWEESNNKLNDQNPDDNKYFIINGSMVVKFATKPGQLIGVPNEAPNQITTRTAADYDGDEFNVISVEQFPQFAAMVQREMTDQIINPKISKTFTPLKKGKMGFFDKILELWQPILERWTTVRNVICILSPEQFHAFCEKIVTDHQLAKFVGAGWRDQLAEMSEHKQAEHIVMLEIQCGIKFGEDALKTEIPTELILNRVNEYENLLRQFVPLLQVPYGKALMRKLSKANSYEEIVDILKPNSLNTETYNVVHAAMVATLKKFVA